MLNILKSFVDLLIPKSCFCCQAPSKTPVCVDCKSLFNFVEKPYCEKCGYPTLYKVNSCRQCRGKRNYFNTARSLLLYEGSAKKAILSLKLESAFALADYFAHEAVSRLEADFFDTTALTYMPTTFSKKIRRPHNASELLAKSLAYYLKIPVFETLAIKKKIKDQAGLKFDERMNNLRGALKVKREFQLQGTILLVDDIYTTGATANEACKALMGKNLKVNVFTLGRTMKC
ncbi:MAG: ComF family protein [Actinobacteria bacterium]|nr:MAG: ComF family protein [Actinomycetota bacterium]